MEIVRQIWDDKHGDRIEVGPDRDGLDMTEVRFVNAEGKIFKRMAFTQQQARMVAAAMVECADEIDNKNPV